MFLQFLSNAEKWFLFLFVNTGIKKKKKSLMNFYSLFAIFVIMSTARVVLCFYRVVEVQLSTTVFLNGVFSLLHVIRFLTVINASAAATPLEQRPEKNSGSERDSNPRPLRCRCSALPTELLKPHESGRMWVSPFFICGRYTWPKYSEE